MQLIKTLKTNSRDILFGLAIILGVSLLADFIETFTTFNGQTWLNNVAETLRGLKNIAAANLATWMFLAVAWPTVNRFSNDSFQAGWDALDVKGRFHILVAVALFNLVAAAICFS